MVGASHVRRAAGECVTFLGASIDADWDALVPDLDFSVIGVVAHAAEGCLWYAIDLAAGGKDVEPVEHRVKTDNGSAAVLQTLKTHAAVVASVIEAAPTTSRGYHPMGSADPSGFAAMACDEMLIHTDDAARGLGLAFNPAQDLAEAVLRRLFPWVTDVTDPWEQLRWANGRIALGDLPQVSGWAWHCSPLDEWDGRVATRPQQNQSDQPALN